MICPHPCTLLLSVKKFCMTDPLNYLFQLFAEHQKCCSISSSNKMAHNVSVVGVAQGGTVQQFFLADTYAKEKSITIAATSVPYTLAHRSHQ